MRRVLFIDRDGTLIVEPEDEQIDSFAKLQFVPGVITQLARIAQELDYLLVMITNQDGLGTAAFPEETFWPVHNHMLQVLEGEGIVFDEVLIDRTYPEDGAPTRKPGTGMLTHYIKGDFDLTHSFVIGDRMSDVQLAKNLGANAIYFSDSPSDAALNTTSWGQIFTFLKGQHRMASVSRQTAETQITVSLDLDGAGAGHIKTGIGFFDHMLEQLAKHGGIDLEIEVKGDLEVDEHHTIEDTGLTLGEAFDQALGSRKGIGRYGFLLPMDDSLAQVAVDFGGRPWLVWNVQFRREKIGDMPTEMFSHFFKSFCDKARCSLNIRAEGHNEHHMIEAIFKGWARAIRMATKPGVDNSLPSTKGML